MRMLDLFCGAGGCTVGYSRAGFDVVGVDCEPQPRYPFEFIQGDAIEVVKEIGKDFDAIHASPPCQPYSIARNTGQVKSKPALIEIVRAALIACGKPWIIENVEGAPLFFPVLICGAQFGCGVAGLDLPRHRLFESSHLLLAPPCSHRRGRTLGVYGGGTNSWHRKRLGRCITEAEKREAMGIDWMRRHELAQAIPPAYTEFLGNQLKSILELSP